MNELVIMKDKQAVTTSLQVAEGFEKQHKHVIEAIEAKIQSAENSAYYKKMFAEGIYKDSRNRDQKLYYMNRDGFTFIGMGFTGAKADEFKLKYIEAFNQMEAHIKQELDTSALSPELQMFNAIFKTVAQQELATKQLETKVDNISEIVALNTVDWRKDANKLINKIVRVMGNTADAHKEVRNNIFQEVDRRAGTQLNTRLTNKRRRMADEGVSKSKRDTLSKVDVIADDKKLVEIYVAIVKEFAINYGVYKEA